MHVDRKDPQGLRSSIKRLGDKEEESKKDLRRNGLRISRKTKLVCALEVK